MQFSDAGVTYTSYSHLPSSHTDLTHAHLGDRANTLISPHTWRWKGPSLGSKPLLDISSRAIGTNTHSGRPSAGCDDVRNLYMILHVGEPHPTHVLRAPRMITEPHSMSYAEGLVSYMPQFTQAQNASLRTMADTQELRRIRLRPKTMFRTQVPHVGSVWPTSNTKHPMSTKHPGMSLCTVGSFCNHGSAILLTRLSHKAIPPSYRLSAKCVLFDMSTRDLDTVVDVPVAI
ncbi:uncharacterized protein B0H18DRAFT_60098 [Fomitopsis serialis]|uniref:uncharacterized protein n=1 Tax=Fomitopsis serialis TaxID=139415 RepID=UPI002007EDEB|nr:uncharacterized protein B0H18DRAFT_60098 [Neoantrodia serialis]KAH9916800.1 hypothetical protein B0H18DRAFT_60098 [Neoantrodia serialis]